MAVAPPQAQLRRLAQAPLTREFHDALEDAGLWPLTPTGIDVVQVNVGKLCNQRCRHCHVDAGPDRREVMTRETMSEVLAFVERCGARTVDITGGAPELNPDFRWLVEECRARGAHVIDRCNLTILQTGPHRDLPEFFARHEVEVVCSLPHYRALNTDKQRGAGVYEASVAALKRLNAAGYGQGDPKRRLVLVTNPVGAYLPGAQRSLEAEWKRELLRLHDVRFDALYCLTNLPISRYLQWLEETGNLETYLHKLADAFNPAAAASVMCRSMISVGWDGRVFDCDFNQMLELEVDVPEGPHAASTDVASLLARRVRVGRHCFGCTAGAGSSCGGATTA